MLQFIDRTSRSFLCVLALVAYLSTSGLAQDEIDEVLASPPTPAAPKSPAPLPWNDSRAGSKMPGRKLANAKEMLELFGVDASQWRNLFNDQPLDAADEQWIDRILFHYPRVGLESVYRWRKTDWKIDEVLAHPDQFQGDILAIKGRAKSITRIDLLPELQELFEFEHYYRVLVSFDEGKHEAIVCTRVIPKAWEGTKELDEPVEVDGVFLKTASVEGKSSQLVVVADRVRWFPEKANVEFKTTDRDVYLGKLGMDAGLWDQVRQKNLRPLSETDREGFYALLAAMEQAKSTDSQFEQAPKIDIASMLAKPDEHFGQPVVVDGTLRRIDQIKIEESDIRTRFGIDHYYVLYVFVPLRNQRIRWGRDKDDANARVFENEFPVSVCLTTLPPDLKASPTIHEHIRLTGTLFKIWLYTPAGAGKDLPQPSPMVIGNEVQLIKFQPRSNVAMNWIAGAFFAALMVLVGFAIWQFNQKPVPSRLEAKANSEPEEPVDLSKLET